MTNTRRTEIALEKIPDYLEEVELLLDTLTQTQLDEISSKLIDLGKYIHNINNPRPTQRHKGKPIPNLVAQWLQEEGLTNGDTPVELHQLFTLYQIETGDHDITKALFSKQAIKAGIAPPVRASINGTRTRRFNLNRKV